MKAALTLGLLCAAPLFAFAQTGSSNDKTQGPKVRTGSRVSGVTVRFAAQDGGDYKFWIQNRSGHAITAYDVLLVPSGVKMKNNHFLCQGRCAENHEIKTVDQPAIKAGDTVPFTYDAAAVKGGAVVLETAVFDDASYEGNERAAAYLVAQQLGQQGEFDRIVFAVEQILDSTGPQNADKASRIYSAMAGLAVDADSATIVTFERWFPNVRDCAQRFPQVMKSAAAPEVADVESKLEPMLTANPSDAALTQWWTATEQFMAKFGCSGCTAKMDSPTPPVKKRMISIGCNGQPTPAPQGVMALAWSVDDSETEDDDSGDGADQVADDGGADQDSGDDELSMTEEAADLAAPAVASTTPPGGSGPAISSVSSSTIPAPASRSVPTSVTVTSRHTPMAPRLFSFSAIGLAPGWGRTGPGKAAVRPVPDEQLYDRYFQYVTQWTRYLSEGGTPEAAKDPRSPDPFPEKLGFEGRNAVTATAYDYIGARREGMTKLQPAEMNGPAGVPTSVGTNNPTGAQRAVVHFPWEPPPLPDSEAQKIRQAADERLEERDAVVKSDLEKLKARMGQRAYRQLDAYVHEICHAIEGRWVRQPLPENTMLLYYLRYIAAMDRSAENSAPGDWAELAKRRADEQQASGLSDGEETILRQVADDLQQSTRERQAQAMAGRPHGAASVPAATVAPISVPATMGIGSPEGERIRDLSVEQLKIKLGETGFEKVKARVHALYGSVTTRRIVAASDSESANQAKVSNKP